MPGPCGPVYFSGVFPLAGSTAAAGSAAERAAAERTPLIKPLLEISELMSHSPQKVCRLWCKHDLLFSFSGIPSPQRERERSTIHSRGGYCNGDRPCLTGHDRNVVVGIVGRQYSCLTLAV